MVTHQSAQHVFDDIHSVFANAHGSNVPLDGLTFQCAPPPELAFKLILDATGKIDPYAPPVSVQIQGLRDVVSTFDGLIHTPELIDIWLWDGPECKHLLFGHLINLEITHTLFAPDGTSMRATVALKFTVEQFAGRFDADLASKPSLDLTHIAGSDSDGPNTLS